MEAQRLAISDPPQPKKTDYHPKEDMSRIANMAKELRELAGRCDSKLEEASFWTDYRLALAFIETENHGALQKIIEIQDKIAANIVLSAQEQRDSETLVSMFQASADSAPKTKQRLTVADLRKRSI